MLILHLSKEKDSDKLLPQLHQSTIWMFLYEPIKISFSLWRIRERKRFLYILVWELEAFFSIYRYIQNPVQGSEFRNMFLYIMNHFVIWWFYHNFVKKPPNTLFPNAWERKSVSASNVFYVPSTLNSEKKIQT